MTNPDEVKGQWLLSSEQLFGVDAKHLGDLPYLPDVKCHNCAPELYPQFDNQTSPQADNPSLILWDKLEQRNCVVLDCFSCLAYEDTTYYLLQLPTRVQWRRDDQVEEQATFNGYDFGELCELYERRFSKPYPGTAASIKATIQQLLTKKADVSHARTRDGGREIIGDLSDIIVEALHWRQP